MARGKTEMKRIENTSSREVMFTKRRNGLLKKARELSVLCDAEIGLMVFSPRGKLHEFDSTSMQKVLERYNGTNDITEEHDNEDLHRKIANMKERIRILQSKHRKMVGEDLATCSMMELNELEVQAEGALNNMRARKAEILMAQVEQLKTQEKEKTRNFRSKGKDKVEITVVPLKENRMRTRLNRLKQIGPEKKEKTPARRKRKERMKN